MGGDEQPVPHRSLNWATMADLSCAHDSHDSDGHLRQLA